MSEWFEGVLIACGFLIGIFVLAWAVVWFIHKDVERSSEFVMRCTITGCEEPSVPQSGAFCPKHSWKDVQREKRGDPDEYGQT